LSLTFNAVERIGHSIESLKADLRAAPLADAERAICHSFQSIYYQPADVLFILFESELSVRAYADMPIVLSRGLRIRSHDLAHAQNSVGEPVAKFQKCNPISMEVFLVHAVLPAVGKRPITVDSPALSITLK
jgi:hypothetical protein